MAIDNKLGWEEVPADTTPDESAWDDSFEPSLSEFWEDDQPTATSRPTQLGSQVLSTLRSTLSALHGMSPTAAKQLVERVRATPRVIGKLDATTRNVYDAVFEVFDYECTVSTTGVLDLGNLPVTVSYADDVRAEIALIVAQAGVSTPADPHATWHALVESVQRHHTRLAALELAAAIDDREPLSVLLPKHTAVEIPTTQKATIRTGSVLTAAELTVAIRTENAGKPAFRFSSGLPTLDVGYTGVGEAKGFIAPGQFAVVMGPTGTGKSSFANAVTPAFGIDMQNWGVPDAFQVLFHTEEESIDKIKGFRMDAGQKYHHLAKNLVVEAIGTSRKRMAETLYDLVIAADKRARTTRRPITDFLPYIVQLDYIQSIQEQGENETEASARTAEFLLRGVVAWNPEEMAKFSGVDFRTYAGMGWPTGMDQHRVAVLAYAQLVKISDETLFYKPGKRGMQVTDFALTNDKDEPLWDVNEGDLRLFGKNQMRGSGVVANNAHMIVILHRSVPYNNPAKTDANGESHLVDTRARILFDKSRAGSRLSYAPMRFDVQANGFRAQYFDEVAERALQEGRLRDIDASYTGPGDPILPVRPKRSKLAKARY